MRELSFFYEPRRREDREDREGIKKERKEKGFKID